MRIGWSARLARRRQPRAVHRELRCEEGVAGLVGGLLGQEHMMR